MDNFNRRMELFNKCEDCNGVGMFNKFKCKTCDATGWKGGSIALFIYDMKMKEVLGKSYAETKGD